MGHLAHDVAAELDALGVPFALIGASALAARGFLRGTHDIDFMTTDAAVLGVNWGERLGERVTVQATRGDFDDPLQGVVRLTRDRESVDIVVGRWKWQKALIERSERMALPSFSARVPDVADLVLLKLDAGSYLDQRDAAQLIEIHGDGVLDVVRSRLGEAPERLREAFERFVRELG